MQDPKAPMTAGEWARQTRVERNIAALFLLTIGMLGIGGVLAAMATFQLGELTGMKLTDTVILVFMVLSSLTALRQVPFLTGPPVCRACGAELKDTQFRCVECAQLVDERSAS